MFEFTLVFENIQLYNIVKHTIVSFGKGAVFMKRLPDTEFEVMQGVWKCEIPVSTAELKAYLEKEREWNMSALQTVLSRLEEKGFVKSEKNGRNRFYTPLITEKDYLADESRSFLKRLGITKLSGLVAAMYDGNKISEEELEELQQFIDSHRKGD